jgi:heme A synthase
MMETIQRIIGLAIGAIVAMILLVMTTDVTFDQTIMPLVVGGIAAFFWPVVVGWWLVRRAKARREDAIQDEVQRQINQQGRG